MNFTRTLFAAAVLTLAATGAFAQATIDHNKVMAGNMTPGDAAGYPLTITQPGHYKLTGNLVAPVNTTGIEIKAPNVTLDLNGFTISGPVTCMQQTNASVSCSVSTAYADGIFVGPSGDGFAIRNGTVQGFSGYGVMAATSDGGSIERLTVRMNAKDGVNLYTLNERPFRVTALTSELNGQWGLLTNMALVESSIFSRNGGGGLSGSVASTLVTHSQAYRNKGKGFEMAQLLGTSSMTNAGGNTSQVTSLGGNFNGVVF